MEEYKDINEVPRETIYQWYKEWMRWRKIQDLMPDRIEKPKTPFTFAEIKAAYEAPIEDDITRRIDKEDRHG